MNKYLILLALSVCILDVELLSRILYAEARGECRNGKLAVAQVALDRLEFERYGNTLEEVLTAPNQFAPPGGTSYGLRKIARAALEGERYADDYILLYFRVAQTDNDWFAPFLLRRGNHAFYGWPRHED